MTGNTSLRKTTKRILGKLHPKYQKQYNGRQERYACGSGNRKPTANGDMAKGISKDPDASIISKLEPSEDGDFWDVKTAYLTRKDGRKNKKPLWERTQSG